jgi:2-polyprenyl-3-methyl-5-hydroxy-6-metoxy-1,4-benzoquinol methylase
MTRLFVTGVYGSGKTTLARQLAAAQQVPYLAFDVLHKYGENHNQALDIFAGLPDSFVLDAIPIDDELSWCTFFDYAAQHQVEVICTYCPNLNVWLERVRAKRVAELIAQRPRKLVMRVKRAIRRNIQKLRGTYEPPKIDFNARESLQHYRRFYRNNIAQLLEHHVAVRYFDSMAGEYTTPEVMRDRIGLQYFPFWDYLYDLGPGYDGLYEDIEVLNFVGYSQSYKTWERLHDLVTWEGRQVVDLGCHHGYFSFKAADAGARVLGLERGSTVLETARRIKALNHSSAEFQQWEGGQPIPACDIILCLNVLHHFPNPDLVLSQMACEQAILEINKPDRPRVEKYFSIMQERSSHRANRVILLGTPKH